MRPRMFSGAVRPLPAMVIFWNGTLTPCCISREAPASTVVPATPWPSAELFSILTMPAAIKVPPWFRMMPLVAVRAPLAPLNTTLERTFAAERHLIGRLPLPVGLSLFAVASAR